MQLKRFIAVGLLAWTATLAQAQTKNTASRQAAAQVAPVPAEEVSDIDRMMAEYRYDEVIDMLQKEITAARRKKKSTTLLEADLQRARAGAILLEATEKVVFIDSFCVDKATFLQAYRLSRSTGTIGPVADVLGGRVQTTAATGQTAYLNEFADKACFALRDASGNLRLHASYRTGDVWTAPEKLEGLDSGDMGDMDYPVLLADGVTLYYAAQGDESLGGYDIFVTRYNSDTKRFVKAENIGMPFNSPFNDYLYVLDEETGLGWFVSDRFQPADKVCVYAFLPNESREVYTITDENRELVRQAALLRPFASSRGSAAQVEAAHSRLQALSDSCPQTPGSTRFIISAKKVYTSLADFKSSSARLIASQWMKTREKLEQTQERLAQLRRQFAEGDRKASLSNEILRLEAETEQLRESLRTLENNMRRTELSA